MTPREELHEVVIHANTRPTAKRRAAATSPDAMAADATFTLLASASARRPLAQLGGAQADDQD